MDFKRYLKRFETEIILEGLRNGYFTKEENVSVRPGKLSARQFGKKMGGRIDTDDIIVVDYYGFQRKSNGFFKRAEALQHHIKDKQVKSLKSPIVHFGSIKIEVLARITSDMELLGSFPVFKEKLIQMRWGK